MTDESIVNTGSNKEQVVPDHSDVIPTPNARQAASTNSDTDSVAMSSETMSMSRSAMKDMLQSDSSRLNISDLAAGQTEPKASAELDLQEKAILKIYCHKCQRKLDVTYMESFSHFDCPSCSQDLIVPQWFDNFLLEEKVGIGGMAEVYRALDLTLDREVAIKVLNPELHLSAESRDMFLNEAKMAANISSHAVVPIYTCGTYDNKAYLAMQFMPGKSLENVINEQGGTSPITECMKWLKDVADGLKTAMASGVVHHDIKPGNLMLDFENRAKICDFGLSQAVGDTQQAASRGWVSPHYVSPEKLISGVEDFKGDIYSLGTTFYHIMTGETAFSGNNIEAIMRDRLERDPVPVKELRSDIPNEINELIMAMVNRDPVARPDYNQIIEHISMFMMSTMKKKRSSLNKKSKFNVKPSTQTGSSVNKILAQSSKKSPIGALLKIASLVAVIGGGAFYTLESNFFAEPQKPIETIRALLKMAPSIPEDKLSDVTAAFAAGDIKKAEILANIFLESGSSDIEAVKQAMLQISMARYLRHSSNADEVSAVFLDKLASLGAKQGYPDYAISYLCGKGISEDDVQKKLSATAYGQVLAKTVILVKNVYSDSSPEKIGQLFSDIENIQNKESKTYWGSVWLKRIKLWKTGLTSKVYTGLEPVFNGKTISYAQAVTKAEPIKVVSLPQATVAKPQKLVVPQVKTVVEAAVGVVDAVDFGSKAKITSKDEMVNTSGSVAKLTTSKLTADRRKFSGRPKPAGFKFSESALKKYFSRLSKSDSELEGLRCRRIDGLRSELVHLNNRTPVEVSTLKLTGKSIAVTRVTLTPDYISVKMGGKLKKIDWRSLSPKQFLEFLVFYAERREAVVVSEAIISKEAQTKNIAMVYYNIAVFCDWYGDYKNAVKYAKKTISVDSRFINPVNKLFGL